VSTGDAPRRAGLLAVGWFLTATAALSLLASGIAVPRAYFGTIAVGPADPAAIVGSFSRAWVFGAVALGVLYASGLGLIALRGWARTLYLLAAPMTVAISAGLAGFSLQSVVLPALVYAGCFFILTRPSTSAALRQTGHRQRSWAEAFAASFGALLSTIAGGFLAVAAAVAAEAPLPVSMVAALWSLVLTTFAAVYLSRSPWHAIGVTLVAAGVWLVPVVIVVVRTAVSEQAYLEQSLDALGVQPDAGRVVFISRALATLPMATSILLVVGLPPLVLASWRRRVTLPPTVLAVGLLLVCSSLLVPRAMQSGGLLAASTTYPPPVSTSLDMPLLIPPPPPPPPPPPSDVRADTTIGPASTVAERPVPPPADVGVRVGGSIPAPRKLKDVPPVYPAIARAAGVEGVVILEITIGPDGTVVDAKVLRSIALLDSAAVDAVKQWEFTPTVIDGRAVPLIMTVTVDFRPGT
jgi:protein TonB